MMGSVATKALRKTSLGMRKLRTDMPYYQQGNASYSSSEKQVGNNREYPIARKMIPITPARAPTFSVMSYNILADVNVIDNGQYHYTPKWALPFSYRFENLVHEIELYNPDIICLQEVDHDDEIAKYFESKGYASEFSPRGGRFPEGCQTLYKTDKFTLVDVERIRFNQIVEEYGVNKKDYRRSNVAQALVFEMSGYNFPLLVGNTHLYWDPSYEYVKVAQAHYLMHSLDAIKKKHKMDFPTVLCGDFNSKACSRVYELIKRGLPKDRAKRKDVLLHTHNSPLVSSYECRKDPPTNFSPVFTGTLDYIFYSKKTLSLASVLEEIKKDFPPLQKYSAAPNPAMPSDHVPIISTFAIEPTK